jgi:hypothetical protein
MTITTPAACQNGTKKPWRNPRRKSRAERIAAGEGGKRARASMRTALFYLVTAREVLLFCSPRPGSGRGVGGEGKVRATTAFGRGFGGA